jgi:hypothetical protein
VYLSSRGPRIWSPHCSVLVEPAINVMPRKKKAKKKRTKTARGPKEFSVRTQGHRSTVLSGDLQGLSRTPGADSESVSELVEEGNPFEAEIVNAVEAGDDIAKEVRTREVPEDDVPKEYLDED